MTPRVRDLLAEATQRFTGNASSPHAEGQSARLALESAREKVAAAIGVRPSEVVFTSGGTESNNSALRGVLRHSMRRGGKALLVTTEVEHPSILETCTDLEQQGVEISRLRVDSRGVVDPDDLADCLDARPAALVSVMHANNETGAIQPVEDLARRCRERGVPFHADMVQSAGKIPIRGVMALVGLCSIASHKVGGPAGIGALVIREGTPFAPFVTGGAQEGRRRAGTEPVPLAVAFAEALSLAVAFAEAGAGALALLRDRIESALPAMDKVCIIHAQGAPRLPNTTNFFFRRAPGRMLVMQLDQKGYSVSTGSACSTGSSRPSHVLAAMGCSPSEAFDSVRVSLGSGTTESQVAGFIEALGESVTRLGHGHRMVAAEAGGGR